MDIHTEETGTGGRYSAQYNDQVSEMTYSRASPKLIIIDHTDVPTALRGQGIGLELARFAVEEARKGGWKIIPLCPFFRAQFARNGEWADVVNAK